MSYSYTLTSTFTFTLTHARYLASKVKTDLKRIQRLYPSNGPKDSLIEDYEIEMIQLLVNGYLGTVKYGFIKNGNWIIPTLLYTAENLLYDYSSNDDPGKIPINADVTGAVFSSYLTYSDSWYNLSEAERHQFKSNLPFYRQSADESSANGYFSVDLAYFSGGRLLRRSSLRSY